MGCHRLLSPGAAARPCCARAAPSQEPGTAFPENRNNFTASPHERTWRVLYQLQEKSFLFSGEFFSTGQWFWAAVTFLFSRNVWGGLFSCYCTPGALREQWVPSYATIA